MAKPKSNQPSAASATTSKKPGEAAGAANAASPLLAQVNALLARGDNLAAKALLAQHPDASTKEPALAAVSARLRFDPGALAAAGGVLAAILFALVAAILLRK